MNDTQNNKRKITLLFLGSTGAGPVYSLEMAKALAATGGYELQVVVSRRIYNLAEWKEQFAHEEYTRFDVVDTYKHNILSFAVSLLEFWKVKYVVSVIKRYNPECVYIPFPSPWDFLLLPVLYKHTKITTTLHDPHPHDVLTNPFARCLQEWNKRALRYVNNIVILNNGDVDYVKKEFGKPVQVIPHASFTYYTKELKESGILHYTIGFVGRIEPYKGLDLLIDAFERIKDNRLHLIVAGSGEIEATLLKTIKGDRRIELINRYIQDDEFSGLIGRMDFVVLPYKRASQSGVIPLVFSHGKTVIVTDVGALKEQVPEGTGIITSPSTDGLIQAITALYEQPERIREFGSRALQYANTDLSWTHSVELLMPLL